MLKLSPFVKILSSTSVYVKQKQNINNILPNSNYKKAVMMKLFTDSGNPFAIKILASAFANDIQVDIKDEISKHKSDIPGVLKNKTPVLEVTPGRYLFDPNTASCFLFNKNHKYTDEIQESVTELVEWDASKIQPIAYPLLNAILLENKKETTELQQSLTNIFMVLESKLESNQYLLGPFLTAADMILCGTLYGILQDTNIKDSVSKYVATCGWFTRMSLCKSFAKAVGVVVGAQGISAFKTSLENYVPPSTKTPHSSNHQSIHKKTGKSENTTSSSITQEGDSVTDEEIHQSKQKWDNGEIPTRRLYDHPVLPRKGEKNLLITSALPYVNNVPHLGNIIGCTLSGDVYARYCRLRNYNCIYVCGTDEYGTATETKAIAEGLTPQQICDKYHEIHSGVYDWFNINFDIFGRTTTKEQTKITQDIFWKVHKNGCILEDTVEQLQCQGCQRFLADRFVEGTCPFCKFEDARGDQCDACGKLINAVELINPRCKQCGGKPESKFSKHLFLNLTKIDSRLQEWIKTSESNNWSNNAKHITKSWIAEGLKPRCISRDLKWGTPVPLEGYTDKVFYVWFDAPIGYLSITANYTDQWEKWWKNPQEVQLVQFMAKDNVPFHTVVFPSSLLAADDNFTLLTDINSTEYLNYEDAKFSKSRGVGVFGDHAKSTGIPADIFRFYLLFVRPETSDSAFQWDDLVMKNNSELLNNLGNFVNRALMFLKNSFGSVVPDLDLQADDYQLIAHVNKDLHEYIQHMENIKLRDGLKFILNISRSGNQYIQVNQPWVLVKGTEEQKRRAATVIALAVNLSALLSILMKPYMPLVSTQLQQQLAFPEDWVTIPDHFMSYLKAGHRIGTPEPLFVKLENSLAVELKKRFAGKEETIASKTEKPKQQPQVTNVMNGGDATVDPVKVNQLEEQVIKQGEIVRNSKTEKAEKDVIDAEVRKLLELKRALAIAQGLNPDDNKKTKGKKKGGKKK